MKNKKTKLLFILVFVVLIIFVAIYYFYYLFSKPIVLDVSDGPPMTVTAFPDPCDVSQDGDCDFIDKVIFNFYKGGCDDGWRYITTADADHDGCITDEDKKQLFSTK